MSSRLPFGLLAAIALLAAVLLYEAAAPVAPIAEPMIADRPAAIAPATMPAFVPPPEAQFSIVNARAAFDPARQAVSEPPLISPARAAATPQVTLVGVILGGNDAVALLRKADGQTVSVRMGQSVDGWQLVRIALGQVVFRAGATDYTVTLRAAAGLAQPPLDDSSPPPSTEKSGP